MPMYDGGPTEWPVGLEIIGGIPGRRPPVPATAWIDGAFLAYVVVSVWGVGDVYGYIAVTFT